MRKSQGRLRGIQVPSLLPDLLASGWWKAGRCGRNAYFPLFCVSQLKPVNITAATSEHPTARESQFGSHVRAGCRVYARLERFPCQGDGKVLSGCMQCCRPPTEHIVPGALALWHSSLPLVRVPLPGYSSRLLFQVPLPAQAPPPCSPDLLSFSRRQDPDPRGLVSHSCAASYPHLSSAPNCISVQTDSAVRTRALKSSCHHPLPPADARVLQGAALQLSKNGHCLAIRQGSTHSGWPKHGVTLAFSDAQQDDTGAVKASCQLSSHIRPLPGTFAKLGRIHEAMQPLSQNLPDVSWSGYATGS